MSHLLILGHSQIAKKQLIPAARGNFSAIDIASRRPIEADNINCCFDSYEKALKESKADVVYVSLVNSEHAHWARQALESGRHCIVDKPAFLNQTDAMQLVALAVSKNLLLAEATVWTQHPQVDQILSLFEQSQSPITKAVALFSMPPFDKGNFRWKPDRGGGAIYDLGPYFVSSGRALFSGAAESVHADIHDWHNDVPLSFSVQAKWPCGGCLIGHFGFDSEYINRLEILNEKMHVTVNRAFTTPADLENVVQISQGNRPASLTIPAGNSFEHFFKNVLTSIQNNNFQYWHQDLLDDAQSMALLLKATKEDKS